MIRRAPARTLRRLALAALAGGLAATTPGAAQHTLSPPMQQAVDALARALREQNYEILAPYLDDSFHLDQLTGDVARQMLRQVVASGHRVPTAIDVESVAHEGTLVRATARFAYPESPTTVALVLTGAGKFVEIPIVQVRMSGMAGAPPPNAVGGLHVRMGDGSPPAAPASSPQPAHPAEDAALHDELMAMLRRDQQVRQRIVPGTRPDSQTLRDMREVDSANVHRLQQIVTQRGWPGSSLVGTDGSRAAFLILQHADQATQERYLPMVRQAVAHNEMEASLLATLEDRVRMRRGERQLYGTQLRSDPATGKLEVWPIEDEAHVDARRAAVGLQPLAEYLRYFGVEWPPSTSH